jgi:hypothetical protein
MDSSHIELNGSQIASLAWAGGTLRIGFSRAHIVKAMTGSRELTRWWQAGTLVLDGVEGEPQLPHGPLVCAGGDIEENVFVHRDSIPIPFASRGRIRCLLRFEGIEGPLDIGATAIRLELEGVPKYIEHIRPG